MVVRVTSRREDPPASDRMSALDFTFATYKLGVAELGNELCLITILYYS